MKVVLLGPQGAGKGAQAERLAALTGARHVSTGDVVRAQIQASTPTGTVLQSYHDRGELVPDQLMVGLTVRALAETEHWILDGFPRNAVQAHALDEALSHDGTRLDRVIILQAPDALLMERLAGRRQSGATGRVYHLVAEPPPPDDPGPFLPRADDTPDAIRRRLAIYHMQTEPLQRYYAARTLLSEIDAIGSMDEVLARILAVLGAVLPCVPAAAHVRATK